MGCSVRRSTGGTATRRASAGTETISAHCRLPRGPSPPRDVLIIGAAGGQEVLASLSFGVEHIDAIELNPVTYDLVTEPVRELRRPPGGASRRELREGRRPVLPRTERRPLRPRVVPRARQLLRRQRRVGGGVRALRELPVHDATRSSRASTTCDPTGSSPYQYGELNYEQQREPHTSLRGAPPVKRSPRSGSATRPPHAGRHHRRGRQHVGVDGAGEAHTVHPGRSRRLRPPAGAACRAGPFGTRPVSTSEASVVSDLITTPGLALDAWYDAYPYDVHPITDDSPFFWHFTSFEDAVARLHRSDRPW